MHVRIKIPLGRILKKLSNKARQTFFSKSDHLRYPRLRRFSLAMYVKGGRDKRGTVCLGIKITKHLCDIFWTLEILLFLYRYIFGNWGYGAFYYLSLFLWKFSLRPFPPSLVLVSHPSLPALQSPALERSEETLFLSGHGPGRKGNIGRIYTCKKLLIGTKMWETEKHTEKKSYKLSSFSFLLSLFSPHLANA